MLSVYNYINNLIWKGVSLPNPFGTIINVIRIILIALPVFIIKIIVKLIFTKIPGIPQIMFLWVKGDRINIRNKVYSYCLDNAIYISRLWERTPSCDLKTRNFILKCVGDNKENNKFGLVIKEEQSTIAFLYALFKWLWLDDDSNVDIYDMKYNIRLNSGEQISWLPKFIRDKCLFEYKLLGDSFDLGTKRIKEDFHFWPAIIWNLRNSGYNYNYFFEDINVTTFNMINFYYGFTISKMPQFEEYDEDNPKSLKDRFMFAPMYFHFGYIPSEISTKNGAYGGRLVSFTEDTRRVVL